MNNEKLVLLDGKKFIALVKQSSVLLNIMNTFFNGNATDEKILESEIYEGFWVYNGDLTVDGEFNTIQNLPEGVDQLFVNGDLIASNVYAANMDMLAVDGSIKCTSAIFQNTTLLIGGNLEALKGTFFGDTHFYTEVKGSFVTERIVLVTDGKFNVNNIASGTLGIIGKNSYSESGDKDALLALGLAEIVEIENLSEYKEAGNAFGAFNLMVK